MNIVTQYDKSYQTPAPVCTFMAELVPDHVKTIFEPTPGEGNLVRALQKRGFEVTAPNEFQEIHPMNKFDAVVMNPPYLRSIENQFLYRAMEMAPLIIALMPWFSVINSDKRTKDLREFGLQKIVHLPRKTFPAIRVQTCIIVLMKGYNEKHELEFFNRDLLSRLDTI